MQGSRAAPSFSSRLRRERQRRNWILADVVREIDVRLKDSGVTESLVSAWELGKHRPALATARCCARSLTCHLRHCLPIRIMKLNPRWGEWRTGTLDLAPARSGRSWSVRSISFERHY